MPSWVKAAIEQILAEEETDLSLEAVRERSYFINKEDPCFQTYQCKEDEEDPLLRAFVQLNPHDAGTLEYIKHCDEYSTVSKIYAKAIRYFYPLADSIAFVKSRMHVLSTEQAERLLREAGAEMLPPFAFSRKEDRGNSEVEGESGEKAQAGSEEVYPTLLDVGAGEGNVTLQLAPLFNHSTATEVSPRLVEALKSKGFPAVLTDMPTLHNIAPPPTQPPSETRSTTPTNTTPTAAQQTKVYSPLPQFSVVSLLNVLDRCDEPETLLKNLHTLTKPDTGRLLIAVVLPFRAAVETKQGTWRDPKEKAPVELRRYKKESFEMSVTHLRDWLRKNGWKVLKWTRVPYLSQSMNVLREGTYALLQDVIMVCEPIII